MTLPLIFLVGRPAAGKSEVIRYLNEVEVGQRKDRFHFKNFYELDDFSMLWAWFEEDALLEQMGKPRLHTSSDGYFLHKYLWNVLIQRLDLEYNKKQLEKLYNDYTAIIEFSRGSEHGGFAQAFSNFSDETLEKGAVLYIKASYEESLRKNRKRFNPEKPHSILEHGLPDEKLEKLYKESDWEEFTSLDPDFLHVKGIKIPYAVLDNEDDVTTPGGEKLGERLETCFNKLFEAKQLR